MQGHSREELLALTPARYLSEGFLDEAGAPRPALRDDWATAAATQLLAAELAPQELTFTVEAFHIAVPMHADKPPPAQAMVALQDALETVRRMIRQPNNQGLVTWARDCALQVRRPGDVAAMEEHMRAVQRLYGLLASLPQPPSSSPSPSPAA